MANNEDRYEFNAPQHFFDFTEKDSIEVDESYFDCPKSAEFLREESQTLRELDEAKEKVKEEAKEKVEEEAIKTPKESAQPEKESAQPEKESAQPEKESTQPHKPAAVPEETPKRHPPSPQQERNEDHPHEETKKAVIVKPVKSRKSDMRTPGVRQSPRLAAISKALRRSNATRRSLSVGSSRRSASPHAAGQISRKSRGRTAHKPKVVGMHGLSPDDRAQLETIAIFKKKIADHKKKNDAALKSTRTGPTKPQEFHFATDSRLRQKNVEEEEPEPEVAPKPFKPAGPTRPKEFHFATDSRIKTCKSGPAEEEEPMDFTKFLRSSTTTLNKDPGNRRTVPQPFNLTESRKIKTDEPKFVSMAELNLKFHTKTPQRFRSKRAGSVDDMDHAGVETKKTRGNHPSITIPHTPNFQTRTRSRNLLVMTHEEKEQKEFEEAQKHAFKAHPVNKKVFDRPKHDYPVDKKVTAPEPFNLTHSKKAEPLLPAYKFQEMCEKMGGSAASLASIPHGGVMTTWNKTSTKPQPFSFDSRDRSKFQHKLEMIQKVVDDEKKLAEFHANPMPVFEEGVRGVPAKKPPTPTRVQPFNLQSDQRGACKQEQIKRNLEEEAQLDVDRRKFHAQSDDVVHRQPFLPEKSTKPLTDISGFTLNTELRAEERGEYEIHLKRKENEILAAKREQEERQAAEEAAEVARLRREAVHKAHPVRKFKQMVIAPTSQPVTAPISPKFATDSRMRSRATRANSSLNISSATFTAE